VTVSPDSSEGWIVLGAAKQALGDPHAAREAYRRCAEVGTGVYVEECRRMAR
jgi:cytochrome c-type biogenesis protein CcmH/NrfG